MLQFSGSSVKNSHTPRINCLHKTRSIRLLTLKNQVLLCITQKMLDRKIATSILLSLVQRTINFRYEGYQTCNKNLFQTLTNLGRTWLAQ